MTKLNQLADLGQAIWLDYIRRSFLESGELQDWIGRGLRGLTSNPSIFDKAIAGSSDYDDQLRDLVTEAKSVAEIYEKLVLDDIAHAAELLRPVYDNTHGLDGYVSIEVNPHLANDAAGTVAEIERFARVLDEHPNVMFKIPATPAGVAAIQATIAQRVSVNVTLVFSVAQYEAIAEAYLSGLEQLDAVGGDLSKAASVASVFVSRLDTLVDRALDEKGNKALQGKIAIANAKAVYARSAEIFSGKRWKRLAAKGARVQRMLWASTSTKNPLYPDTLYVDALIGPHTVNTVPPATLKAFLHHGIVAPTLRTEIQQNAAYLQELAELGIDLNAITEKLQQDGVAAFSKSFENLLHSIAEKREQLLSHWHQISLNLGEYAPQVETALADLTRDRVIARLWDHDYTLWSDSPAEITDRLGWLYIADSMLEDIDCLEAFADDVRAEGYTHALLLGMGGSSLAAQVLRTTFGVQPGFLDLAVLDSTDPRAVQKYAQSLPLETTLFVVSTKTGTTVETISFFKYFYNRLVETVGEQEAGRHFVAITDPKSPLTELASDYGFRTTFLNDPNIGGRYSALSYVGLVPAALIGLDLEKLLNRSLTETLNCELADCTVSESNRGALLGVIMSTLAVAGRDKLTLIASPAVDSFGDWVEQLIAESTGKEGKGILPVVGEPVGAPSVYGDDRLFVHLRLDGDESQDQALSALEQAGHPVVRLHLRDLYDLGRQFFEWEMATAVASYGLGINPFDQPNVESAKELAQEMVAGFKVTGELPTRESTAPTAQALHSFLQNAAPTDYIALQAFVQPTLETDAALLALRTQLRDRYHLATTVGYGPRFLHSTGQLHKGDAGNGLFVQFATSRPQHVRIPDQAGALPSSLSFGVLIDAQALGDTKALQEKERRTVHFSLGKDVVHALKQISRHGHALRTEKGAQMLLLAGDIGGTKTNLALFAHDSGLRAPLAETTLPSAGYGDLSSLVREFLAQTELQPTFACFGVAGPVVDGRVSITNLPWVVDEEELETQLDLASVRLLNDLESIANAIPRLELGDLHTVNDAPAEETGAIAVIAPGTGLGEAFLTWDGVRYAAQPSEGGHADFAPTSPLEVGLLRYLWDRYEHVSYERVCSGLGIPNIYAYLRDSGYAPEPPWLRAELAQAQDPTPVIVNNALGKSQPCDLCLGTLDTFVSILGAEAGNLALKALATGGVYLAGGIPPRILPALERAHFMRSFYNKGRFGEFLARIPVYVIMNPKAALLGAAAFGLTMQESER